MRSASSSCRHRQASACSRGSRSRRAKRSARSRRPAGRRSSRCGGSWESSGRKTATSRSPRDPSLAQLDALAERVREAGLPVEVRVEGDAKPLSPGVDLSAYRIVQEALTNTLKHAGPASARVVVRYEPEEVELEITDDGRGASRPRRRGTRPRRHARARCSRRRSRRERRQRWWRLHRSGQAPVVSIKRPDRGRPGARPHRVSQDPGVRARPRGGCGGRQTAERRSSRACCCALTSC